ncbi:MAG: hypothetical protein R3A78_06475 [Polyangiales bacterium]|nr:hypothetical protein [Myxococcales bacterium]
MLATHHTRFVAEDVRGRPLVRAGVRVDVDLGIACIANAVGLPRLWGRTVNAALDGFVEGFRTSRESGRARVDEAVRHAQRSLKQSAETLIERMVPDVAFTAVVLNDGHVHAINAGTSRIYVHRQHEPKRLTPRTDETAGLLRTTPTHASEAVAPGDLVLLGTQSAFSVRAIGKLASLLDVTPNATPDAITKLLVEPAESAGVGAAAVALRVH